MPRLSDHPSAWTFAPSRRPSLFNPFGFDRAEWWCCIVGACSFLSFPLGGRLTLSEILIFASFPFVFRFGHAGLRNRTLHVLLVLAALYLGAQILTDSIRQTPSKDSIRGIAKIAVLAVCMIWMACAFDNKVRRFAALSFGGVVSTIFKLGLGSGFAFNTALFKFGYGPVFAAGIPIVGLLLAPRFSGRTIGLALAFFGFFCFFMNSRSLAGMCVLGGVTSYLFCGKNSDLRRLPILVKMIGMAVCAGGIYYLYQAGASSGTFGAEAEAKFARGTGDGESVFSSSRGETFASIPAIMDSPIIGHGSWARDPRYVVKFLLGIGVDLDSYGAQEMIYRGLIPTHSHFFGAWVESGIAGGLFWFVTFIFVCYTVLRATEAPIGALFPVAAFFGISFLWDIVFSPFGLDRRMGNAALIIFFVILVERLRVWRVAERSRRRPAPRPLPSFAVRRASA